MRRVQSALTWATGALLLAVASPLDQSEKTPAPTWAKDIAPLFHERCTECHTDGGAGPFPLETYRDVVRRRELVRQEVLSLEMPPCNVTSDYGDFCPSKPLSNEQIVMLQEWLRDGAPEGEGAPKPPRRTKGWRNGGPGLVLRPPVPIDLPIEGNPVWQAVVIDPKQTTPLRIRGFDVATSSPQALRHVLLAVASDAAKETWTTNGTLDENAKRLIGSWAPGFPAWRLPDGVSMVLKPGERLVLQLLLVPTGKVEKPQIELGLYTSQEQNDKEPRWISMEKKEFQIDPYAEVTFTLETTLTKPVRVISIVPEARFFAYAIRVHTGAPNTDLFHTIKWNPYWVGNYTLPKLVTLKAGTRIVSEMTYENELHSPINEGLRPRLVYSGPGLKEEVCRTHVLVVEDGQE